MLFIRCRFDPVTYIITFPIDISINYCIIISLCAVCQDLNYSTNPNIVKSFVLDKSFSSDDAEVEFYAKQMESLGVDLACSLMTALGYKQDNSGVYYKPGSDN